MSPVQLWQGMGLPSARVSWVSGTQPNTQGSRSPQVAAPSPPPGHLPLPAGSPARKPAFGPCWPQTPSTWASLSGGRRSRRCSRTCGDGPVRVRASQDARNESSSHTSPCSPYSPGVHPGTQPCLLLWLGQNHCWVPWFSRTLGAKLQRTSPM